MSQSAVPQQAAAIPVESFIADGFASIPLRLR